MGLLRGYIMSYKVFFYRSLVGIMERRLEVTVLPRI